MKLIVRNSGDRDRFIDLIKQIDISKPFTAIFEPVKKKRSLSQNKLIHLWFKCLEDETGTSAAVWKEYFKKKFLTVYHDVCFGKDIETVTGTSELTTGEFKYFVDSVHQDALEQGYYLPWPDDMGYDDFILKYGG